MKIMLKCSLNSNRTPHGGRESASKFLVRVFVLSGSRKFSIKISLIKRLRRQPSSPGSLGLSGVERAVVSVAQLRWGSQVLEKVNFISAFCKSSLVRTTIKLNLHDVTVPSGAVSDVMERFALDNDWFWSVLSLGREVSELELAFALLDKSSISSPIVEVYVWVSSGSVHSVVGLLGGKFDIVRFHVWLILWEVEFYNFITKSA